MRSILLIENDLIIAMDIRQTLQSIGYEVEIVIDGVEGLKKIKQKVYDLIITTNDMPRINGEQLYKEVLALDKDLAKKILFISANITDFIKSTGNPFLEKPFSNEELIEAVKKLIS
jgi:CheY-like chemotaxis protein